MSDSVRIYFDGRGADAPVGATVLEALDRVNPVVAAAVRSGEKAITDSRGLPSDTDAKVYNGAIFRIVTAREKAPKNLPISEWPDH